MERIRWIDHGKHKVLLEDFSGMQPGDEFYQLLDAAKKSIHSQKEKSVLALFDATGALFNMTVMTAMKEFVQSNTPYIKAAAVVGVEGLLHVALQSVSLAAKRNFKPVRTREEGLDWLADQAEKG